MNEKKFEIQLVSLEAARNNEELLANLNAQIANAKNSPAGIALQKLVNNMEPLPVSVKNVTKEQLNRVRADKNILVKARTSISKNAKRARDLQTGINRAISAYEKSILEIAKDEEDKRKEFIKKVEIYYLTEERKKSLPEYKARFELNNIPITILLNIANTKNNNVIYTPEDLDDYLLTLDTTQRDTFYNECFAEKLEQDRIAAEKKAEEERKKKEEEEARRKEEEARALREKEQRAQAEREAKLPERRKRLNDLLEDGEVFIFASDMTINMMSDEQFEAYYNQQVAEKNARKEQKIKEKEEAIKRAEQAKLEVERQIAEEKAKKEAEEKAKKEAEAKKAADKKYQTWLKENNFNDKTDKLFSDEKEVKMYRLIATYKI